MKQELLNPTLQQIKHRNRLWVEALRKNKKKAKGEMYDGHGGRCCLAVAQDVAMANGVELDEDDFDDAEPHVCVSEFFGWGSVNPSLFIPSKSEGNIKENAVLLNDEWENGTPTLGMSHKRIAECVENTFVHPSKKKWSFTVN
jgi:hypothetical protein